MGKVMKADGSAAAALATLVLPTPQADVWQTFPFAVAAADLAVWVSDLTNRYIAYFENLGVSADTVALDAVNGTWNEAVSGASGALTLVGDTWATLELHRAADLTVELYVNETLVLSGDTSSEGGDATAQVQLGIDAVSAESVCYYRSVKVGTTRGGDDLGSIDFASGDLSGWTSTEGDLSVVDDPWPPLLIQVFVAAGLDPQDDDFTLGNRSGGGDSEWGVGLRRGSFNVLTIDEAQQTQLLSARVTQTGPSARTEIYSLDIAMRPMPSSLEGDDQ